MFKFKGISSIDMQVVIEEEEHFIARAAKRYDIKEIEGKDGAVFDELGYSVVERPIYVQCLNINKIDDILSWLDGEGEFEYKGRKTIARFYSELEPKRKACIRIIDTTFIRDPFWFKANEDFTLVKDRKDKTASGENITIKGSANMPFKEISVSGNDYQETREGYNLLIPPATQTKNGITFTVNKDNSITVNGTATADASINFENLSLEAGTYKLTGCPTGGSATTYRLGMNLSGNNFDIGSGVTKTISEAVTDKKAWLVVYSGTTVNNLTFYPMLRKVTDEEDKPYKQYGAMPSLDYPSDVRACGDNIQLFDKDNVNKVSNYIDNSGYFQYNATTKILYMECEKNKDYAVSSKYLRGIAFLNEVPKAGVTSTNFKIQNTTELTLNSGDNTYLIVWYYASACTLTEQEVLDSIKICKGTTTGRYSEYGQGSMSIFKRNSNMFDINGKYNKNGSNTSCLVDGDTLTVEGRWYVGQVIKLDPNTDYEVSYIQNGGYIDIYTTDLKTNIYRIKGETAKFNSKDYTEIAILFQTASTSDSDLKTVSFSNIMFKPSSETSDYVKHQSKEYIVPTQQPFYEGDTFVKVDGVRYEKHNYCRYIFTGDENWQKSSATNMFAIYSTDITNKIILSENTINCKSNYFKAVAYSNRYEKENIISARGNTIFLGFALNTFNSVDEAKSKMRELYNAGTPMYIVYKLTEPMLIECTDEQNAILDEIEQEENYKNITHIYSEDEISPTFDVEYIALTDETILNEGNIQSRPILRLEKTISDEVELTINNCRFKYDFKDDNYVEIDCEEKTIKYDGLNRNRNIKIDYNFPKLEVGNNNIIMHKGDCIIKILRKDRWL